MEVEKIAEGLWRWAAPHPAWTPESGWDREVSCFYYEGFEGLCLIDPLVPAGDEERFFKALDADVDRLGLPVSVILTVHWHERSAAVLQERYGAEIWAYGPAIPHLACAPVHGFDAGDPLPGGLEALDGDGVREVLLWIPDERALVSGDLLIGEPGGVRVCPDSWLPDGADPASVRANLRMALALPIERILVCHGPSVLADGRRALERALEEHGV